MTGGKKVKVYGTQTCPYCFMAKDYLKAKGVEFEDVDVGSDARAAQEMVSKSGQTSVPVIDYHGKIIVGFDREAIDEELRQA
ncbi:MAG: glutaredoxin domain-containing protein [Candidatus Micrarchaeota archaeon]